MRSILIALIVLVVLVGGFFILKDKADAPVVEAPQGMGGTNTGSTENNETTIPTGSDLGMEDNGVSVDVGLSATVSSPVAVTYTESGFSPASITVKKGQVVLFLNNADAQEVWVASAIHPTHGVYPQKSASDCLGSSFDACKGIKIGESWEFTFTQVGSWNYHDHLHTSKFGKVIVTE